VATLFTDPIPARASQEVRMLTVEYPPGVQSPPHRHPGAVYAYVLEGEVLCALDDGPVKRYGAGEWWTERPGQLHRVSTNASTTRPAKLLVFFVTEHGQPVIEPQHHD
jgi:quercetin dioxygenase-like cupin family protein